MSDDPSILESIFFIGGKMTTKVVIKTSQCNAAIDVSIEFPAVLQGEVTQTQFGFKFTVRILLPTSYVALRKFI